MNVCTFIEDYIRNISEKNESTIAAVLLLDQIVSVPLLYFPKTSNKNSEESQKGFYRTSVWSFI